MKRNKEAMLLFLYRLLNAGVLSSAVILYYSGFFGRTGVTWKHVTVLLLTIAVFWAVRGLPKRQQMYALLSIALFLAALCAMTDKEKFTAWLFSENGFLWTFALAVSACVLELLFEKNFLFKIVSAVIVCLLLIGSLFTGRHVPQTGVACLLLYVVMTFSEAIRMTCGKKKKEASCAYLVWIAPFLALYFCVLCLTPAPETPYSWQWLKDIYLRAEEKVSRYVDDMVNKNQEDLDGAVSGFSEKTALISRIEAEHKDIMAIETQQGKKQPLYLAGKIFDSFDGRSWESTEECDERERLFDTIETVYALDRYAQSDPAHPFYYHTMQAKAQYRQFRTAYLLAPTKVWKIEGRSGYRQEKAALMFEKRAGYGTEYTFSFCRMNLERDSMRDFLQRELPEDETLWEKTVKRYAKDEITYEAFLAYRESIPLRYLKETALGPETEKWLAAVTKEAENDVDKLFLIEEALAGMQYQANPGGLPGEVQDGQSFLTYFLTKKPEGFCTHFATAFVLLARAEGFPARYVQGFCIPLGNEKETEVCSHMAHAWPEVYIEGRGWIPFEPTPGYGERRYAAKKENTGKTDSAVKQKEQTAKEQEVSDEEALKEQMEKEKEKRRERRRAVLFISKCALLILITCVIVFVTDRLCERFREKRRSMDEKYRRAVLRNLQILSMLGYEREQSETYQELAERIGREEDETIIPTAFLAAYESILYGTCEAGERELEECVGKGKELMQVLRKKKGKLYLFYWIKLNFF